MKRLLLFLMVLLSLPLSASGTPSSPCLTLDALPVQDYTGPQRARLDINLKADREVPLQDAAFSSLEFCAPQDLKTRGYWPHTFYYAIAIRNPSPESVDLIISSENLSSSYVELWELAASRQHPFEAGRRLKRNYPAYAVTLEAGETRRFILEQRFAHYVRDAIHIEGALVEEDRWLKEILLPLLCFGVCIGLSLYNLFLYASLRQRAYLFYVFTVLTFAGVLYYLSGFHYLLFAEDNPIYAGTLCGTAMMVAAAIFAIEFLNLHQTEKRMARLFTITAILGIIAFGAAASAALPNHILAYGLDALVIWIWALAEIAAYKRVKAGFTPARFYALSWGIAFVGYSIWFSYLNQLLPESVLSKYALNLGMALEMTLISLALGELMNSLRKQFISRLMQVNDELEAKVLEKTSRIQFILQRIKQGIFTVDRSGKIELEYSLYLEGLVGEKQIHGRTLSELILSKANISGDARSQLVSALEFCLGEDSMSWELNQECFPRELSIRVDGQDKIIEFDWEPEISGSGRLEKILVTMRDVTALRDLTRDVERSRGAVDIINEIVTIGPGKVLSMLEKARDFMDGNNAFLKGRDVVDDKAINFLLRQAHTLKGEARTYRLKKLASLIHDMECEYGQLRRETSGHEKLALRLQDLDLLLTEYHKASERLFGTKGGDLQYLSQDKLLSARIKLGRVSKGLAGAAKDELQEILNLLSAPLQTGLFDFIRNSIDEIAKEAAASVDKPKPRLIVKGDETLDGKVSEQESGRLYGILLHIVSNSLAHGIEAAATRQAMGKTPEGCIRVVIQEVDHDLGCIFYKDDGAGLDLTGIVSKGKASGLLDKHVTPGSITLQEMESLVLKAGFSTAHGVTQLSGRGAGMDAAAELARELGGRLELSLEGAVFTDAEQHERIAVGFRILFKKSQLFPATARSSMEFAV